MRINGIDIYSNDRPVLQFDVSGPDYRNPYILRNITGLDADDIIPIYYSQGIIDGTDKFYDLTLQPREIVIRIAMNPNYNLNQGAGDLRKELYKMVASSRTGKVELRFNEENIPICAISGFIRKVEAPVSQKEMEVQVTIQCDDPMFRALHATQMVLGSLDTEAPLIPDPVSTSPHGVKFTATFLTSMNGFVIQDDPTDPTWRFILDHNFIVDDVLYFSSEYGDKFLYVESGMTTTYLMDKVDSGSIWPLIFPGDNQFYILDGSLVSDPGYFEWNEVFYTETHWGI